MNVEPGGGRTLRERWAAGEACHGLWSQLPGAMTAELLARTGADFVVLDLQHGALAEAELPGVTAAVTAAGSVPLVRTRSAQFADVGRPLDLGAHGVLVPNVLGADHVREVVAACCYAPRGNRSAGRLSGGVDEPLVLVVLETAQALAELDAVLAVDGLDGVYVGPVDLASSLGLAGDPAQLQEVLSSVITRARAAGVPVGVHAFDGAGAASHAAQGATIVTAAMDTTALASALAEQLRLARGA
ncbi:aldolase/citrate lyase family protein [Modestobacter sp. VKM Ac-2979]|uniref:HpcH/HpaI aldolase family protein n=1 Tax=unclassified Modestobacter TaxID=2643866 RepID=UPI0022AB635B|nr:MULTISPECIES: aldolase/citrate lyase family protein [unclassified Modestobacter]MCZ2811598.1 aldolase/citrate lyase family protein [Modestobacter sp. VKM Ac-2979]MCZ2843321.1 aldolase/citrate lyase family protein [Modestobacter sp. VKM Ac-2980]